MGVGEVFIIATLGIVMLVLVGMFLDFRQKLRLAQVDAGLKQEMLARGLSVDEIERLVKAFEEVKNRPNPAQSLTIAVQSMVESEKTVEEIALFLETHLQKQYQPDFPLDALDVRQPGTASLALANALESMVKADNTEQEISACLELFHVRSTPAADNDSQPTGPKLHSVRLEKPVLAEIA